MSGTGRAILLAGLLLIPACARELALPATQVPPESFNAHLAEAYLALSDAEAERFDRGDARRYRDRAAASLRGETVAPEPLSARVLPAEEVGALAAARVRLVDVLEQGAAVLAPKEAARAQAMFDCWMEEQEEGHQPADIAVCRDGFTESVAAAEGQLGKSLVVLLPDAAGKVGAVAFATAAGSQDLTRPLEASAAAAGQRPDRSVVIDEASVRQLFGKALRVEPPAPTRFLLYFIAGTDRLTPVSETDLDAVRAAALGRPGPDLSIVGHTDTKGPASVNERLARRRADAVAALLVARGLPPDILTIESFGEADPVQPTGDDVDEPLNRRVEVTVR